MKFFKRKKTKFYRFLSRHPSWYRFFYAVWPKTKRHRLHHHVYGNLNAVGVSNSYVIEQTYAALLPKTEEIYRKLKLFEGEK